MSKWFIRPCKVDIGNMCRKMGINVPLALALQAKGLNTPKKVKDYFNTENYSFGDITELIGVKRSFEIIEKAINENKKIFIYGDYDVDGVTSTVILYKSLKALGANVFYYIPNRVTDGYGLNINAIERLIGKGMELLITCDNGIAAIEEIKYAKEKGIDVVIYDHHEPVIKDGKEILPEADSVTDAKIENCGYDFTVMCAGGLCYRVMKAFYEYLGQKYTLEKEMVIFAGIATVCDVVDLIGENRAIAKRSLELINDSIENTGLRHLVDINSLESINEFHYGFVLGPCINACGRLEDASIAVELFIQENEAKAGELALKLFELNAERKAITLDSTDRIINEVENSNLIEDKVLVVYDKELHESIAGIVAGRLKERYNKPAIVLTKSENGVKGSCRSIDKYNIFEALNKEKEYLGKFGGHKLAAGLSLPEENVEKFRCSINQHCSLNKEDFEQVFYIDGQLPFDFISLDGAEELDIMHPFGTSNTKPIFGTKDLTCRNIRFLGENKTIVAMELADKSGNSNRAIMFNGGDRIEDILLKKNYSKENCRDAEINIDALYTLEINEYKYYRNVQLNIKDFREI